MYNILGDVSSWYRMSPQKEECSCGKVYAWGILIVRGFTIMGWHYLSPLYSMG